MEKYDEQAVEHPSHYTMGRVEAIDAIEDALTPEQFRGYCVGNALKYLLRANWKHPEPDEDIAKARWYLNRCLEAGERPEAEGEVPESLKAVIGLILGGAER